MEFFSFMAPAAFVFALAAIAQVGKLKKDVDRLKGEMETLKQKETV